MNFTKYVFINFIHDPAIFSFCLLVLILKDKEKQTLNIHLI